MLKSFPFYKQLDAMDCSPTCLCMLAKYYGRSIPLDYLLNKCQYGKAGVSLLGLADAAKSIGLKSVVVTVVATCLNKVVIHFWKENDLYKLCRELKMADTYLFKNQLASISSASEIQKPNIHLIKSILSLFIFSIKSTLSCLVKKISFLSSIFSTVLASKYSIKVSASFSLKRLLSISYTLNSIAFITVNFIKGTKILQLTKCL